MDRLHALSAVARGLGTFLFFALAFRAEAAPGGLSGVVKDSLGNALSGAEVLILAEPLAIAPIVSVQTNTDGRYRISELAPGVYRVAALKQGYLATLGQIDTLLRSSMDFVLRPAPRAGEETGGTPDDLAWTLRVPQRSLLRETEARELLRAEGKGGPPSASPARFYETIQGQVEHLVAFGGIPSGSDFGTADVQGADTRMRVSSSLGERGSVQVQGRHESLDTADGSLAGGTTTGLDASSVFIDVAYDTGNDSSLAVKAYYGDRDLSLSSPDPVAMSSVVHEGQRAWGYDASWQKVINASSRLALRVGYLETETGDGVFASDEADGSDLHRSASRLVGAQGLFETIAGDGHHVSLGVRTERVESPGDAIAADPLLAGSDLTGWIVRMSAEDAWAITGPVSFVYGIGVDQGLDPAEPFFVAPHAGWILSSEGLSLRMIFSYRAVNRGGQEEALGFVRAGNPLGYEVQAEAPLPYGIVAKASTKRTPAVYQGLLPAQGIATLTSSPSLLPILDGAAGARHSRFVLERQTSSTTSSIQWTAGTLEGVAAQLLPLQVPLRMDGPASLRYWSGRIGVRVIPTGTDLAAEYVRVRESSSMAPGETGSSPLEEYVELRIVQDLLRLPAWGGSCRLLVAARTSPGSGRGSEGSSSDSSRTLAALNHRLSAGVSVAF